LELLGYSEKDIQSKELNHALKAVDVPKMAKTLEIGELTLKDIISSLLSPMRDMREEANPVQLRRDVLKMEDIQAGMAFRGTVRNVVDFGAFVDIGVKQDGLVHLSQLSKKFVKKASDVVKVGDVVDVWVLDMDQKKGRISLSMLAPRES